MLASWLYGFDDFLGERPAVGTEILDTMPVVCFTLSIIRMSVPTSITLAKARIYELAETKTLKKLHDLKIPPKVAIVLDFICNFAMSMQIFACFYLQHKDR